MARPVKRVPKKPYKRPSLTVYGTIRELTKAVGVHGKSDQGIPPRRKTQA